MGQEKVALWATGSSWLGVVERVLLGKHAAMHARTAGEAANELDDLYLSPETAMARSMDVDEAFEFVVDVAHGGLDVGG